MNHDDELFKRAMRELPPEVLTEITNQAIKDGLMPKPSGYDSAGNPLWRLEDVARHMGLSEKEHAEMIEKFELEHGEFRRLDPSGIHRIN